MELNCSHLGSFWQGECQLNAAESFSFLPQISRINTDKKSAFTGENPRLNIRGVLADAANASQFP